MSGFRSDVQKTRARGLRTNMTPEERLLWYHLRAHRFLGLSVRRQAPVGPYIVDFLIPAHRLILELDGGHHAESPSDPARDAFLAALGYSVLRVWNHEARANLPGVLTRLAERLRP